MAANKKPASLPAKTTPLSRHPSFPLINIFFWHLTQVRKDKTLSGSETERLKHHIEAHHLDPHLMPLLNALEHRPSEEPKLKYRPSEAVWNIARQPALRKLITLLWALGKSPQQISSSLAPHLKTGFTPKTINAFLFLFCNAPEGVLMQQQRLALANGFQTLASHDSEFEDYARILMGQPPSKSFQMSLNILIPSTVLLTKSKELIIRDLYHKITQQNYKEAHTIMKLLNTIENYQPSSGSHEGTPDFSELFQEAYRESS